VLTFGCTTCNCARLKVGLVTIQVRKMSSLGSLTLTMFSWPNMGGQFILSLCKLKGTFTPTTSVENSNLQFLRERCLDMTSFCPKLTPLNWLTKPQALNSLSKCKVGMLILRYQEGNDIEQMTMHDKTKHD
jgi:hypothetical protein